MAILKKLFQKQQILFLKMDFIKKYIKKGVS